MTFATLLDGLLDRQHLGEEDAEATMDELLAGELGPERIAALVTALRAKGPHVDELVGFAKAMRRHATTIDAPAGALDNCGTGGAACKSVNISTASAFVLAGAGIPVAKHGNRSVTRPSGSADVLEALGANLSLNAAACQRVLRDTGIAFLFAPTFHPAMRHAGPVRQALGVKTVFNLLGPLCNPAGVQHQVLGVYDERLVPMMAEALARLGCKGGFVLHGQPGFDEATPCGPVRAARIEDGEVHASVLDPSSLGMRLRTPGELAPVAAADAPGLLRALLAGDAPEPLLDTVALNVAFGLVAARRCDDLKDGLATAHDLLSSGAGNTKMDAFLAATQT